MGRLFRRFHRVRTVARSYEGTGIGLALVKELTELHGVEVSARSTVGVGSEFVVRIPLGRAHLPAEHVHEEAVDPAASIAPLFVEEAASWIEPADGDPASPGWRRRRDRRRRVRAAGFPACSSPMTTPICGAT